MLCECARAYSGRRIDFDQLQPALVPFFYTTRDVVPPATTTTTTSASASASASASSASQRLVITASQVEGVYGPFFRLSPATQKQALELLFAFRRFSKPLLKALAVGMRSAVLSVGMRRYILELTAQNIQGLLCVV